jgi:serine/threonine protein phosphatase PrpC
VAAAGGAGAGSSSSGCGTTPPPQQQQQQQQQRPARLFGLNIARMLGDRYLKEQDVGFTAQPFVGPGVALRPADDALLVLASDGLWDVVSQARAAALAVKAAGDACSSGAAQQATAAAGGGAAATAAGGGVAAAAADALMQAALKLRSRDDISIMVLHVRPA